MACKGVDSSRCKGCGADCVDEGVEDHEGCGAVEKGGFRYLARGKGLLAEEGEDVEVDKDGAEHGAEDPEVMEPETLDLEGVVDPALELVSYLSGGMVGSEHTQALART